jgi:hypothetical protein
MALMKMQLRVYCWQQFRGRKRAKMPQKAGDFGAWTSRLYRKK